VVVVVIVAVESGHELAVVTSDACAAARRPCWDDGVGRFLLVVISAVYASHHTHRTVRQSYGTP
jgi:hypothetical protein